MIPVAILALVLSGVPFKEGGTPDCPKVRQSGRTISIDGFIDHTVGICFQRLSRDGIDILEVRSSGGEPEASLAIAEALYRFRPKIVIHDFCGSACAYLFLPTASKIEATPNSIVLFHQTSTSTSESLGGTNSEVARRFAGWRRRELALYAQLGARPWLLRAPFIAQHPKCRLAGLGEEPLYMAQYKAVLVDKAALSDAGIQLPSNVAGTPDELLRVAEMLPDKGEKLMAGGIAYLSAPANPNPIRNETANLNPLAQCET